MRNPGRIITLWSAALILLPLGAQSQQPARATSPKDVSIGTFELNNDQTGVIRKGSAHIATVSAFARHSAHLPPFGLEGIEITFHPKPLTKADQMDMGGHDAHAAPKGDFAALTLWFDKNRKVTQANMTLSVPGVTVGRTVASTPSELSKYFSNVEFDGKRIKLDSRGKFKEVNDKQQELSLFWEVQLDVPVVERPAK